MEKRKIIIVFIVLILIVIVGLWGSGIIPKREEYRQKYEWQDTNIENNEESYFYGKVIESNA